MDKAKESTELVNNMRKLIFQVRSIGEQITLEEGEIYRLKEENKKFEELARNNVEVNRLKGHISKNNSEIKKHEKTIRQMVEKRESYIIQESSMNDDLNQIAGVNGGIQVKLMKLDDFFNL